jgi:tRNA-2-methylthio-N6-dimethylallyladenosine synthase
LRSEEFIGQTVEVLVESFKKSTEEFSGRNSQNIVVFSKKNYKWRFCKCKINCTSGTLKGQAVGLSEMN